MSILHELNRRNVTRAAFAYLAGSWLLIQIADTVFPAFGYPDRALTILIVVVGIGFIPTMVIAWIFEFTPAGLKKDKGPDAMQTSALATRTIDRAIIVVLVIAVGYFSLDKFVLDTSQDQNIVASQSTGIGRSIAVLAFDDFSPAGDQGHLADGLAEDILGLLANVRNFRVAARTSSFSFKNKDVLISEIGEQLNVSAVLEGSIRRAGDRLRVSVQLTNAQTESAIWSKSYDREIVDIFDIQDDIASSIIFELEGSLVGDGPKIARVNPAAYTLYLKARQLNHLSNPADSAQAIPLLEQSIELEPRYALAIAELARATFMVGMRQTASIEENRPTWEKCIALIDRASEIDPTHPFIVAWQGWIEVLYYREFDTGLATIDRALELGPNNYDAMRLAMVIYWQTLLYDRAIELSDRLLPRDPLCVVCQVTTAIAYAAKGRISEVRPNLEFLLASAPDGHFFLWMSQFLAGVLNLMDGDAAETLNIVKSTEMPPQFKALLSILALHDAGRTEESEKLFQSVKERWSSAEGGWYMGLAAVYAWTGDYDNSFDWVMQDIENFDDYRLWNETVFVMFLRPMHGDPRWQLALDRADERYADKTEQSSER